MSKRYKNVSDIVMNISGEVVGPGRELTLPSDTHQLEMLVSQGYLLALDATSTVSDTSALGSGDAAEELRKAQEAQAAAEQAARDQADSASQTEESQSDAERRQFLIDEIKRLTGKAPDKRLGLDKLEAAYQEAANAQ